MEIVPVIAIDDFVYQDIDLFKVDAQGYDFFALKGAHRLFTHGHVSMVVAELYFDGLMAASLHPENLIRLLTVTYDMICFDSLPTSGMSVSHPSSVRGYLRKAYSIHDAKKKAGDSWGFFDDLTCIQR